jgi:subtilisin family serine protease
LESGSPALRPSRGGTRRLRAYGRLAVLLALTGAAGVVGDGASGATPPPVSLCIVLDPLLRLGCPQQTLPPARAPAAGPAAPDRAPAFESAEVRPTPVGPRYDPRRLTVTFARGTSRTAVHRTFVRAGVTVERAIAKIRAYMVGVAPERREEALAALRNSPGVASAGREVLVGALDTNPDDTDWPRQAGLRLVGFPKAWDVTRGSSRVVVAVVDTGVDATQADLRGALVPGYDFVNSDADPADDEGHGSAVAGIIAARADNHQGVAGICWNCSIMPVKVLDAHGTGDDTVIAAGIVWAVDRGARVINLSLGGPETTQSLSDAIAYAAAKGAIVVGAAGNSGTSVPFYPAADPNAIGVAGTTATDQLYPWSNHGSWVNVAAPGCNIAPELAGGYGPFCGTSSATPVVSGLAALVLSVDPNVALADVRQLLARSAVPLPGAVQYGRIDASRTLATLQPPQLASIVLRGTVGGRVRARAYTLNVGGGDLTATLTARRARTLRLSLLPAGVRRSGAGPVRLTRGVAPGPVKLVVGGGKRRVSFVLRVSYVMPRR